MDKELVKIGEAARLLGTTPDTLRKWESTGELLPKRKTQSGTRYYEVAKLLNFGDEDSSKNDQKEDLQATLEKILDVLIEIRDHVAGTQN